MRYPPLPPDQSTMPTYDYECEACGHKFEQWQSFKDEHLTQCPSCKKKKLRRLFGAGAAILFKGSGFYETDYNRNEDYQKAAKADAEAGTAKPAETKPETPTAAPAPPTPAAEAPSAPAEKSGGRGRGKKESK